MLCEHWLVFGSAGLHVFTPEHTVFLGEQAAVGEQSQDHGLSSPTPRSCTEFQLLQTSQLNPNSEVLLQDVNCAGTYRHGFDVCKELVL